MMIASLEYLSANSSTLWRSPRSLNFNFWSWARKHEAKLRQQLPRMSKKGKETSVDVENETIRGDQPRGHWKVHCLYYQLRLFSTSDQTVHSIEWIFEAQHSIRLILSIVRNFLAMRIPQFEGKNVVDLLDLFDNSMMRLNRFNNTFETTLQGKELQSYRASTLHHRLFIWSLRTLLVNFAGCIHRAPIKKRLLGSKDWHCLIGKR